MPYLLITILFAVPTCEDVYYDECFPESWAAYDACVLAAGCAAERDEFGCRETLHNCVRAREYPVFAECLIGPYGSNIVVDAEICQEIDPPGETWCWIARVATGLDVPAHCERSDRDDDGDVDLYDVAILLRG